MALFIWSHDVKAASDLNVIHARAVVYASLIILTGFNMCCSQFILLPIMSGDSCLRLTSWKSKVVNIYFLKEMCLSNSFYQPSFFFFWFLIRKSWNTKMQKQTAQTKRTKRLFSTQNTKGCNQPEWAELWPSAGGGEFSSYGSSVLRRAPTGWWKLAGPQWPRCTAVPPAHRSRKQKK